MREKKAGVSGQREGRDTERERERERLCAEQGGAKRGPSVGMGDEDEREESGGTHASTPPRVEFGEHQLYVFSVAGRVRGECADESVKAGISSRQCYQV